MTLLMKKSKKDEDYVGEPIGEGLGEFKPWWIKRPRLRKLLSIPLHMVNRDYRRWKNAQLTPRKLRKRLTELDKRFPHKREDLVGRNKEYEALMTSIGYHVIRDPVVRSVFKGSDPPKFFILKGGTGTGKTLLAEVCLRDAILYGIKHGVNVQAISVKSEEIFSPLYGQSVRNLALIFRRASEVPSIIFFDEFQAFGTKVAMAMHGADREDIRVQDAFVDHINKILNTQQRTVVIAATNKFEAIREDIRRRAHVIDLDQNISREMLLAVLKSEFKKNGWEYLDAEKVLEILEKAVSAYRQTQLTPFDIIDACNKVRLKKIEPLRERLFKRLKGLVHAEERLGYTVTLDDFRDVARSLRGYVEQEKSSEVMSAVLQIKPAVSYSDIGGLFGIKEKIFKIISLSLRPELSGKLNWVPPKGFLLWGEPGCGKTYLSKAIAKESNATFLYAPAAQLLMNAKWVGDPEKNVRDLFQLARRMAPSIIFFDEFDVIASKRRGDPVSDRIVAQILTELDGLQPLENVIVIAATNRLEMIDEAVINRFEPYVIEIPLPRNDAERLDVIRVHLKHYLPHLSEEATPENVLSVIKKFKMVSPRVIAEIVREANRIRSQEVAAATDIVRAYDSGDKDQAEKLRKLYSEELSRIRDIYGSDDVEILRNVTPEQHKLKLYHFYKAAGELEKEFEKELLESQESLISEHPGTGVVLGLATDQLGRQGIILLVECNINPKGSGKVAVTGAAKTVLVGQAAPVEDTSVIESASNAVEYVKSYVLNKLGVDLSNYDFKFQVISPMEGVPGGGVTGPSLGVAFSVAAISELSGIEVKPEVVMTGKVDIKGNVGPVGGLSWRGSGKVLAAIKTKKVKIRKFILPKWNYEKAPDELKPLVEEGIDVIPVEKHVEAWQYALGVDEQQILAKLAENLKSAGFVVASP